MKVTVRDIVEAARKNGLKHARSAWYSYEGTDFKDKSNAACIMGQAFYNLTGSMDEDGARDLAARLDYVSDKVSPGRSLAVEMIELNDKKTDGGRWRTYKELVTAFETRAKRLGILDEEIELG